MNAHDADDGIPGGCHMCLAIPGKIVEFIPDIRSLALVEVAGVRRRVDLGLLDDDKPAKGDWVLIHVGFAMSKISEQDAIERVDSVDRERIAYVKHFFNADWPTRSLYHVMLNTAVGNDPVVHTILDTMRLVEGRPKATDYEPSKVPASQV